MANTYTQLQVQCIFSVKNRDCILMPEWRTEIYEYMAGIVKRKGQKPIIIGGYLDHIHMFVGISPQISISDLVRDVKNNSTQFINDQKFIRTKFTWQEGFGAFSYSQSQVRKVYDYILNQEEHHRKKTFKEEYISFLKAFQIEFDEKYLFNWI